MDNLEEIWGPYFYKVIEDKWGQLHLVPSLEPIVEPPQDPRFGDMASSVAMRLARHLKKPPAVIAEELAEALAHAPHAAKVEAAGGYINLTADLEAHGDLIRAIRGAPAEWGRSTMGRGVRVLIEHTSANPTGPMHIAHGRQAAVGDSLASLLAFAGFGVGREFYVNDAGGQIENFGKSILWRYAELHSAQFATEERTDEEGKPESWIVGPVGAHRLELRGKTTYMGDYVKDLARNLKEKLGRTLLDLPLAAAIEKCGAFGTDRMMVDIREDLERFRVRIDTWYSEDALRKSGKIESMLEFFRSWGLSYSTDGAVWLKSTDFGESEDRVLVKSDGSYTYRTPDIAYHRDKFDRGFDWLIDTWGPDHHAEIANRTAGLKALNFNLLPRAEFLKQRRGGTPESKPRCFEVLTLQHCRLVKGGHDVHMGKRLASYVTLRELMEEVGVDAARWFFTMRKTDSPLDFDLDVAVKQTLDNPVYYAQYAHARICSIYQFGIEEKRVLDARELVQGVWSGEFDAGKLDADDILVLRNVRGWPRTVERAAASLDPAIVCTYLYNLSGAFQAWYQRGQDDHSKRVIDDSVPEPLRRARLAVCAATQVTLRNGFQLLGVSAPERLAKQKTSL